MVDSPDESEFKLTGGTQAKLPEDSLSGIPGIFDSAPPAESSQALPPAEEAPASFIGDAPELASPQSSPENPPETGHETRPEAQPETQHDAWNEPSPETAGETPTMPNPMESVKKFSENAGLANPVVPAGFPFSLLITGYLSVHEKEKLLDLLSRENYGIREVDLEPQFENGHILIPRISEYAAVLLVQALRGTSAKIEMGPSDTIFATEETRQDQSYPDSQPHSRATADDTHPAETLPVTTDSSFPGQLHFSVIDVVIATAALTVDVVEAERSSEYQELLDSLTREIKYKAYRKGASGIIHYTCQLSALSLPSHYRLTVMGSAVKAVHAHIPS